MSALRSISRITPRFVPRAVILGTRFPVVASTALRSQAAKFSISTTVHSTTTETAEKLVQTLERELKYESEAAKEEQIPDTITEFIRNSGFELIETSGNEEVKLVKQLDEEKITITFSISDLGFNNPLLEDESFEEELTNGNKNYDADDGVDHSMLDPTPIHVHIVIEKPNKVPGAVSVDITVQDGALAIDNFWYFSKASEAFGSTPEDVHSRNNVYAGPSFETLDEEVQDKAEAYLNERGVDASLAVFVADYANWKEQGEYVRWMQEIAGFVRA